MKRDGVSVDKIYVLSVYWGTIYCKTGEASAYDKAKYLIDEGFALDCCGLVVGRQLK